MNTFLLIVGVGVLVWQAYAYGKQIGASSVPKESLVLLFEVEQVGDQILAYAMSDSTFLARGKNIEETTAAVRLRVPGYEYYIAMSKQHEPV